MSEKYPKPNKESKTERASRILRNLNAVGAVALLGIGVVVPAGAVAFNTLAAINVLQVTGFEAIRRHAKKKRLRKPKR